MVLKKDFQDLVGRIPDLYDDFERGFYDTCVNEGFEHEMLEYMKHNRDATTSELLEELFKLMGNPEPLEIVDDDELEPWEINEGI